MFTPRAHGDRLTRPPLAALIGAMAASLLALGCATERAEPSAPRIAAAGGALTGLGQCAAGQEVTIHLGRAQGYNVFALEEVVGVRDIEGPLAARAACFPASFGIGARLPEPHTAEALRVVRATPGCPGAVFGPAASGQVFGGVLAPRPLWLARPESVHALGPFTPWGDKPGDAFFDQARIELLGLAAELASVPTSPSTDVAVRDGRLELTATDHDGDPDDSDLFTFDLTTADLVDGRSLVVRVALDGQPPLANAAYVLVNVRGATLTWADFQIDAEGLAPERLVFNFPDATRLDLRRFRWQGSVLAPRADLHLDNGEALGTLVVARLDGGEGNGQPRHFPFLAGSVRCGEAACPTLPAGIDRVYRVGPITHSLQATPRHNLLARGLDCSVAEPIELDFDDDALLVIDVDGGAELTGTARVVSVGGSDPAILGQAWRVTLVYAYRGTGAAGQGSAGPARHLPAELGLQTLETTDGWEYFALASGQMWRVDAPSDRVAFIERPAAGVSPTQLGYQANNQNQVFGLYGAFTFSRSGLACVRKGPADLALELERDYCPPTEE